MTLHIQHSTYLNLQANINVASLMYQSKETSGEEMMKVKWEKLFFARSSFTIVKKLMITIRKNDPPACLDVCR